MALLTRLIPGYRLRHERVPGDQPVPALGRCHDLDQHLKMLAAEFAGSSKLELLHAQTVVLLRRGIHVTRNLARFRRLWFWHRRFLVKRLDSRWLVSAADTFADHPRNDAEQATALAAVLLVNTVKLYETERLLLGRCSDLVVSAAEGPPLPLFDGLTTFLVGRGDLLRNLHRRLTRLTQRARAVDLILIELMLRMKSHDTVYSRMNGKP